MLQLAAMSGVIIMSVVYINQPMAAKHGKKYWAMMIKQVA